MDTVVRYDENIYSFNRTRRLLVAGNINGFDFMILSLGTHPTAYIRIPTDFPIIDFDELTIHGGVTFKGRNLYTDDSTEFWIGWDYAHCFDYYHSKNFVQDDDAKKWTIDEVLEEVELATAQLKNYK